jgi:hypothetical protein
MKTNTGVLEQEMRERSSHGIKDYKLVPLLVLLWLAACFLLFCGSARAVEPEDQGTLMLVREWDPKTGDLVGWLPVHRAAIRLTSLDTTQLNFDLNEAVTIRWIPRPKAYSNTGELRVSPEPRVFEGEGWLPVKRDSNVVRVAKHLFLIREIFLGDSKWRHASQVAVSYRERQETLPRDVTALRGSSDPR